MNEIVNIESKFKDKIDELWENKKFSEIDVVHRGYGINREVIKDSLLFIGINPSFGKDANVGSFFFWMNQNGESHDRKLYPYFKKFVDITKRLNEYRTEKEKLYWSHMDLLFHRETSQRYVDSLVKDNLGREFISLQLEISKKILFKTKPKVIVVSNTRARDFIKEESFGLEFKFCEHLGTEIIVNNPLFEGVPVFFTSMLTGQRALDNGSYSRLIWHINHVLNIRNK